MAVYHNVSVPVPPEATVNRNGRVYLTTEKHYDKIHQYNTNKRIIIGWINSADHSTMNPNENYAARFPDQFSAASDRTLPDAVKRIGMFVFSLAVSSNIGLYQVLVDSCGPEYANFVMDFAMYSIQYKSNVAKDFEVLMKGQMLFSSKLHGDSWISEFFMRKIDADIIQTFKLKWLDVCKKKGMKNVWLCIDGSNNDTAAADSEMAEKGRAKSKKNSDIYAYMYAVSADDGTPVTFSVYRGSQVDSKGFQDVIACLSASGLAVEGVILDRGFCDKKTVKTIVDSGYKYVIMMKESMNGFKSMLQKHGQEIRNNGHYLSGPGMFSTVDKDKIFSDSDRDSYIALVYDAENAGERVKRFTKNVLDAMGKFREDIKTISEPKISTRISKYLNVDLEKKSISINEDQFQEELDKKGFSALACSEPFAAEEILALYDLRDASEKQFMILKSQLGYDTGRSHQDEGIESRHFIAFAAGIIRNELSKHCKQVHYELTRALKELNFLCISRLSDNRYMAVQNASTRQADLLKSVGLSESDLDYFARRESAKVNGEAYDQIAKLPEHKAEVGGDSATGNGKKHPGRPKGSKKTEEKSESWQEEKPKARRGRPPGSKNRPKEVIEAEKKEKEARKGKPGRPAGSKNKKAAVNAAQKRKDSKAQQSANN